MQTKILISNEFKLFITVFFYVLMVGLLLQFWLLPVAMPSLHAGNGLMKGGDWVEFHKIAIELAEKIHADGWKNWELRPGLQAPSGIAAALYVVTGVEKPWVVLPLNALLFAMGAVFLFRILRLFASPKIAGIGTLPYVFFPSAIMVYGQLHKDVYAITGFLAICLAWATIATPKKYQARVFFLVFILIAWGSFLVWVVRPYLLQIILAGALGAWVTINLLNAKSMNWAWRCMALGCLLVQFAFYQTAQTAQDTKSWIGRMVFGINQNRVNFLSGYDAGSNIDSDVRFEDLIDVIEYLPRAISVGFFAPFPNMWFIEGKSPGSQIIRLGLA